MRSYVVSRLPYSLTWNAKGCSRTPLRLTTVEEFYIPTHRIHLIDQRAT